MPRPKNGYLNAAGQPIPGTHDPINRFMDQTALKHWAYKQGQQGLPLYGRAAMDIGSTVHGMAELDLRGRPDREIEAYAHDRLAAPDHLRNCFASFSAFREWRTQCHVRAIAQEVALVSETYQYGGTPDTIAMFGNGLGLIDFKTSTKPYPDHLIALAAHGHLWEENHPQQRLTAGYHLLILPKDGSGFQHHAYDDLAPQWKLFTLYLEAYRLDKDCGKTANANVAKVVPKAAAVAAVLDHLTRTVPPPSKPAKPRVRVSARTARMIESPTMAEVLRAYGHVPSTGGVTC